MKKQIVTREHGNSSGRLTDIDSLDRKLKALRPGCELRDQAAFAVRSNGEGTTNISPCMRTEGGNPNI
jgi:hypothetical protein